MNDLVISKLPKDLRYAAVSDAAKAAGLGFDQSIVDTEHAAIKLTNSTYAGKPYSPSAPPEPPDEFTRKFAVQLRKSGDLKSRPVVGYLTEIATGISTPLYEVPTLGPEWVEVREPFYHY